MRKLFSLLLVLFFSFNVFSNGETSLEKEVINIHANTDSHKNELLADAYEISSMKIPEIIMSENGGKTNILELLSNSPKPKISFYEFMENNILYFFSLIIFYSLLYFLLFSYMNNK